MSPEPRQYPKQGGTVQQDKTSEHRLASTTQNGPQKLNRLRFTTREGGLTTQTTCPDVVPYKCAITGIGWNNTYNPQDASPGTTELQLRGPGKRPCSHGGRTSIHSILRCAPPKWTSRSAPAPGAQGQRKEHEMTQREPGGCDRAAAAGLTDMWITLHTVIVGRRYGIARSLVCPRPNDISHEPICSP